ncbi:MAG: hypothetical protein RLZZ214_3647 [Verrucomicrobiota bacterium]|jgi:hypothetical protein
MHRILSIGICLAMIAMAEMPLPSVDLRVSEKAPLLTTWAHAGGKATLQLETTDAQPLTYDVYQVDGRSVIPVSRDLVLDELKPGANRLEIPLPEKSERGKLLFKISASTKDDLIAKLTVDILPKDALDSLSKQSKQGQVWIEPKFKEFHAWAATHGISSTAPTSGKPVEFHFGKPTGNPNLPPPGRVLIYERDQPDAFPVIEVISSPEVTKILLPPGFLSDVPNSATAQALLLKHLKLLP